MPWLYKPCSKKDARFQARCRVFARAARHGKPFLTEVVHPGMKCFPQWCVCGGIGLESTRRWVHGRSGARKSQHPKKQGMASQITGVAGRCFWGCMRSPLHFSPKACVSGFFKEPREGSPMPHLTGFFLTTCTGAPCPTWSAIQGGHDAGRRHPVGRPLAA